MTEFAEVVERINQASRVLIVSHTSPDPDAIGSLLGLWHALRSQNKDVLAWSIDAIPEDVQFLPGSADVVRKLPENPEIDLVIALDSSDPERLGADAVKLLGTDITSINLDHHVTNCQYGTVNVVNDQWASTAEGVLELIDAMGIALDQSIANCLMAGIIGDTRGFSTASVTSSTFMSGARLRDAGADSAMITSRLLHQRSYDALRLWGLGLMNSHLEDGVAWTALSRKERQKHRLMETPVTGLANLLLQSNEAVIAAAITQQLDGRIKCSFRAQPGQDVATPALAFGGGGHTLAAGCLLKGPFDAEVKRVVARLKASVVLPDPSE